MNYELFGASALLFANAVTNLLREWQTQGIRHNNEASAYFEQLGESMKGVAEELRKNKVPRIHGHTMNTLINAFPEKTKKIFKAQDSKERREKLEEAAVIAKELDGWVHSMTPNKKAQREQMIALLERIAGDCLGLAGVLKKPA